MIYVLIAAFSFWFAGVSGVPQGASRWLLKNNIWFNTYEDENHSARYEIRLKPFDCEKCLAFWIGLIYELTNKVHPLEAVLYAGLTSLLAVVIRGLYNRYITT